MKLFSSRLLYILLLSFFQLISGLAISVDDGTSTAIPVGDIAITARDRIQQQQPQHVPPTLVRRAKNSEAYDWAQKRAGKVQLLPGHQYGFSETRMYGITPHRRLIVVKVIASPEGGRALRGMMFELDKGWQHTLQRIHGAQSDTKSKNFWTCANAETWTFKGEVAGTWEYEEISWENGNVQFGRRYNIIWNNCMTHVNELFNKIKAV